MSQPSYEAQRLSRLDEAQRQALLMIASGTPLALCLDALTDVVGQLAPGTRACVLLANGDLTRMGDGYSSHFPPSFAAAIKGLPIGEALIGTCGAAIHHGRPVGCPDVEHSAQWAQAWRTLCLDNGIRACYSHPATGPGGKAVGSFFLCLSTAREADAWERRVAEFGALATSIVVERDRAAARMRAEMDALNRLQALSAELVGPGQLEPLLQKILAAAADISGTDKGNIQIFDPANGTLRIVVHQGLGQRLVEYFREDGWDASCGEAALQIQRLIVPDVEQLPAFEGTEGLEIVREDGIRSIQCTPLVSRDGQLLGMLNNHYRWPGGPTVDALRYIDLLARQAAELLERHAAEEELAAERRRKDEFLAMLAHELRNPLAPLRNMLELQKRPGLDAATAEHARHVMERQLLLLIRLVDDLLDVNRITRGRLELRVAPVDLRAILEQSVDLCRPVLNHHRHQLLVTLPATPVAVLGDGARLTQVFGNLLTNACKYTRPGGAIELRLQPGESDAVVSVKDNGAGIPSDQLDRIFEMFTQVDRTLERAQGGLGIGLMLVKQLVQMHGGTVTARSDGLGQGSEFTVRLPTTSVAEGVAPTAPVSGAPRARRILVVDDNEDAARSLATLLAFEGHEVQVALSGTDALESGTQLRPDTVIMDIGMPGMSGYETCRQLRQATWGQQARVIALTGWGQEDDRHHSSEAGFDDHLVKPVDLAALRQLLER